MSGILLWLGIAGLLGIIGELYVLPGHGVAGTLGLVALVAAVALAVGVPLVFVALPSIVVAVVVCVVLLVFAMRVVPERAFVRRLSLRDPDDRAGSPDFRALVGRHGVASSFLRPAGVAAIDGQRIDVLTEGGFVAAGTAVVVTRVEGARIYVCPEGFP